jgi:hypothetical protein
MTKRTSSSARRPRKFLAPGVNGREQYGSMGLTKGVRP